MERLVDGIVLAGTGNKSNRTFEDRMALDSTEDFDDIDPNYPTTDELDDMDSFLSHYTGFVDKVNGRLTGTDTIALYAVYMDHWGC